MAVRRGFWWRDRRARLLRIVRWWGRGVRAAWLRRRDDCAERQAQAVPLAVFAAAIDPADAQVGTAIERHELAGVAP